MTGLKQRIRARQNVIGCFVNAPSPDLVELLGHAGYDFVALDSEHGPSGTESLQHMMRAAKSVGMGCLVRTVGDTPGEILRALDAGADGVLIPHVVSAAQARHIAESVYYPPVGKRGFSTATRAGRHGFLSAADHARHNEEETVVLLQIEDVEAIDRCEEIAATPGVDGIFLGPGDLSMAMGFPGQMSHPDVVAAAARVSAACAASNIGAATFARDAGEVTATRNNGFSVSLMSSNAVISGAFRTLVQSVRALDR